MTTVGIKRAYPYKFLDAYTKDDTEFFFGRDEEINALYELIFQSDIIVVYGASGTGKTSLIQCGLGKKFQVHDWHPLSIRRSSNINDSLERTLRDASGLQDGVTKFSWRKKNISEEEGSKFQSLLRSVYLNSFKPVYLIFDQLEELFILGDKHEQQTFYTSVQEILLAKQPVKLLFSIREEYLGYLFDFEKILPELLHKKLRIDPMNIYRVREVMNGTTNKEKSLVNLKEGEEEKIADGIFNKIRDNEKTRTIQLPYLQVFLDKIYLKKTGDKNRETETLLSINDIDVTGDIGDVLRDFLEERIFEIKSSLPLTGDNVIWEILSAFVTLEGTKEPLNKNELNEKFPHYPSKKIQAITNELFRNKILRYSIDENTYEIAHDSLAKHIAEKRSKEEIAVLEVKRMVKNLIALSPELRDFFSDKQLQLIASYFDKISFSKEEEDWIEKSEKYSLEQKRAKAETESQLIEQKRKIEEAKQKAEFEAQIAEEKRKVEEAKQRVEFEAQKRRQQKVLLFIVLFASLVSISFGIFAFIEKGNTKSALEIVKGKNDTIQKTLNGFYKGEIARKKIELEQLKNDAFTYAKSGDKDLEDSAGYNSKKLQTEILEIEKKLSNQK